MRQSELFKEGRQRRDDGMKCAEQGAPDEWKTAALFAIHETAKRHRTFTADDVWQYMPPGIQTHDNRALGPVMMSVCRAGHITNTNEVRATKRPAHHMMRKSVWRSNVFREPATQ